ncbi:hypothetical protein [Bradyrhizobium sp. STM 3562]|uniref:hypothetical protein n=1 Tax=Bradyrhizobium sp. STM 3562 TaxID=578924 RepID=UPI00388FA782
MKGKIGLVALMVLLSGTAAVAQSGNKGSSSPSVGQTIHGGIPEAPIGHRQPRAGDVPSEQNLSNPNDPANKEDAALDKKIKSICRGC